MRNKFAAFALAAALTVQAGAAFADEAASETSSPNPIWTVVSFPFRLTTGVVGGTLGLVGGGVKGIINTEKNFAANTYGKADENPLMVPVGLVGTVVAVPVGFVMGAPEGAVEGARDGYKWWDTI